VRAPRHACLAPQGQPIAESPGLFRWRGNVLRGPEELEDGSYAVVDHATGALVYAGPGSTSPSDPLAPPPARCPPGPRRVVIRRMGPRSGRRIHAARPAPRGSAASLDAWSGCAPCRGGPASPASPGYSPPPPAAGRRRGSHWPVASRMLAAYPTRFIGAGVPGPPHPACPRHSPDTTARPPHPAYPQVGAGGGAAARRGRERAAGAGQVV
jgi:hypothetical protein